MINFILIAVIGLILGAAIAFVRKENKKGVSCIGCPDSGNCSGCCAGCAGYKEQPSD